MTSARTPVRAAVLRKPGQPLELTEVLLDAPAPHEVMVRTEHVGLCHSDLHYLRGDLAIGVPALLGHEAAGTVERVGSAVSRVRPGDRVVATVTPSCGLCSACLGGRPTQCRRVEQVRSRPGPKVLTRDGAEVEVLGGVGAFAEAFVVSEAALAVVDDRVPSRVACLLGCCISTGMGAVVHGTRVRPTDTVAVIGCGGVGVAAVQGARIAGARRVVAVDMAAPKLELARRMGATGTVLADRDPDVTRAALLQHCPDGFTHTIEAVGRPETAELAFDVLEPTGTATILGLMPAGKRLSISADALVYGDRRLQGAYMGANRFLSDVEMFADHYTSGRLDLDGMVTTEFDFEQINEGFELMGDPTTIRVVLRLAGTGA